jgi:hypothetical protein
MGKSIQCFVTERTGSSRYWLRRYSHGRGCNGAGYHNARGPMVAETADDPNKKWLCTNPPEIPNEDPRWPKKCDGCDYQFTDADPHQVFGDPIYKRADTGELFIWRDAPPGALRRADWYEEDDSSVRPGWTGPDGQSWECMLPGGVVWFIDGGCNNCTRPGEPHHCWVREGKAPAFTIGKSGNTCSAGAGSIAVPGYHGFLRNGHLEEC